jgi:hypothetical protein
MIELGKIRCGECLCVQHRGGQNFGAALGQVHPHQAQGHRAVRVHPGLQADLAREPVGAGKRELGFPLAGLDKGAHGRIEIQAQTAPLPAQPLRAYPVEPERPGLGPRTRPDPACGGLCRRQRR